MNETERINRAKSQLKAVSETIGFNNVDDIRADFFKIQKCKRAISKINSRFNQERELINKFFSGQKINLNKGVF